MMEPRSLKFAAESCPDAVLAGDDAAVFRQIVTDSRQVGRGDLFLAIRGERFDGHDFVRDTLDRGAAGVVIERRWRQENPDVAPAVIVDDTTDALNRIAASYRRQFELPIVVVAGSNGKTTTKELIASVLRMERRTLWSRASFNNHIGVPLTLLDLDSTRQVAVLEAGSNHPGELRGLLETIAPRYGVLTNIGREHLEHFGDLEGVAEEEGTLAELLPRDGRLFVNGDTPLIEKIVARAKAETVRVGLEEGNDWRAGDIRVDAEGCSFVVESPAGPHSGEYRVNLLGRHHVLNALLAIALGAELGVSPTNIREGIAACRPAPMRMESTTRSGVTVINDAYNANADSAAAALVALGEIRCGGRKIAVLGELAELGTEAAAAHTEIGARAANAGVDILLTVGPGAGQTAEAAREAGMADVRQFEDVALLVEAAMKMKKTGDVFLIKASRAAKLERVADALLNHQP